MGDLRVTSSNVAYQLAKILSLQYWRFLELLGMILTMISTKFTKKPIFFYPQTQKNIPATPKFFLHQNFPLPKFPSTPSTPSPTTRKVSPLPLPLTRAIPSPPLPKFPHSPPLSPTNPSFSLLAPRRPAPTYQHRWGGAEAALAV